MQSIWEPSARYPCAPRGASHKEFHFHVSLASNGCAERGANCVVLNQLETVMGNVSVWADMEEGLRNSVIPTDK